MNSTPQFIFSGYGVGRGIHRVKASVRAKMGAIINMDIEEWL